MTSGLDHPPAPGLPTRWNYPHRLDYHRETSRYKRTLVYTEHIEDHGFCFAAKGLTRTQWHEHYTRICAIDYLTRKHAPTGVYLVTAVRYLPNTDSTTLCTIRLHCPQDAEALI